MNDVLLVRELADGHDLVFAFTEDGMPAWALDRETGLQWWYPAGREHDVRRAIAESWSSLGDLPVVAVSHGASNPAIELSRRADVEPAPAPRPVHPAADWVRRAAAYVGQRPSSAWAQVLLVGGAVLAVLVLLPTLLGLIVHAGATTAPTEAPAVATVGTPCAMPGETSHDTTGHLVVCVSPSRSMSYELLWRRVG